MPETYWRQTAVHGTVTRCRTSCGRSARLWTLSGKPLASVASPEAAVIAASFSPNDEKVLTISETGVLRLWLPSGALVRTLSGRSYWVRKTNFSPDGKRFVGGGCAPFLHAGMFSPLTPVSMSSGFRVWAAGRMYDDDGEMLTTLPGWFAAFDPTGKRIVTTMQECRDEGPCQNRVHLWRATDGAPVSSFQVESTIVEAQFSPAGDARRGRA